MSISQKVVELSKKYIARKPEPRLSEYNPPHIFQPDDRLSDLFRMLTTCRPNGSNTELAFIHKWLDVLPGMKFDTYGNRYCVVGNSRVAWSCHTDTVHYREGIQALKIHGSFVTLFKGSKSTCLGADDTAGIWLMREMILAGTPGTYVFFRGEESGCLGSDEWLKSTEWPVPIDCLISLDRRGYGDVITHQASGKTASDAFARSLAEQLGGSFKPDNGGVFTDSNTFAYDIAECTNLSVGYFAQHGSNESLDFAFLDALRGKLIDLDQSKLVIEREAGDVGETWGGKWVGGSYYSKGYGQHSAWSNHYEDDDDAWRQDIDGNWRMNRNGSATVVTSSPTRYGRTNASEDDYDKLLSLVRDHPEFIADMLADDGYEPQALYEDIMVAYGIDPAGDDNTENDSDADVDDNTDAAIKFANGERHAY